VGGKRSHVSKWAQKMKKGAEGTTLTLQEKEGSSDQKRMFSKKGAQRFKRASRFEEATLLQSRPGESHPQHLQGL